MNMRMATARPVAGFTLMEMLVTLVLVSFTTMLMFQMLGSYRIANERVQAQSGLIDRGALLQSWFRDSVQGLYTAKGLTFSGDRDGFRGITLNPLFAPEGAPVAVEWRLSREDGRQWLVYVEDAQERWRRPLVTSEDAHFAYLDPAGRTYDSWPPKLGKQEPSSLPAVVVLVREGAIQLTLAAAVLGPLKPVVRAFGDEEG